MISSSTTETWLLEVLLGEREGAHAVGFQPERQLEPAGRKRLVVRGEVSERVPVDHSAGALDQLHVLDLPDVGRPLEHQVFEEMREARPALGLGPETDVVDDRDRDERAGAVGGRRAPGARCRRVARSKWPRVRDPILIGSPPARSPRQRRRRHRSREAVTAP